VELFRYYPTLDLSSLISLETYLCSGCTWFRVPCIRTHRRTGSCRAYSCTL